MARVANEIREAILAKMTPVTKAKTATVDKKIIKKVNK